MKRGMIHRNLRSVRPICLPVYLVIWRTAFICPGAIIDSPLSDFEESVKDSRQRELCQKIGSRATFLALWAPFELII
jgi:hypothetical protein